MDSTRPAVRELSEVGRSGRLELVFGQKAGRTVIRNIFSEVPHKVTHLYHPEGSSLAQLIIMNSTAGLFPGDQLEVRLHIEPMARILITSQASTRVHPGAGIAEQTLYARVESSAELHIYNDPLIPFRGARLRQRITLDLAEGARLCFWDGFMAGRIGRGEIWQFDEIDSETRVLRNGKLTYLERYRLRPSTQDMSLPFVMGAATYFGTGLFIETLASPPSGSFGIDDCAPRLKVVKAVAQSGPEYRAIQHQLMTAVFDGHGEPVPNLRKM